MEIRRVQVTGGSSYTLTLPKEWIESLNIKKNDPLGLLTQPDGTLLITSKIIEKQIERIKEFSISTTIDENYLLRQLIGSYIGGYNSIKIISKTRMPSYIRLTVRKFTQITIGQEVVEETDNSIIIKDLLKPAELPFNSTIKRMHIIVKSMHEDAISGLKTGNQKIAQEILIRDNDVDRLHWLVVRQHNMILQNVSLVKKMDITITLASTYFIISRIIERMGDHVVRIAKNAVYLANINLEQKLADKILSASDLALDIFNKSIGSFFRKDIQASNKNIESVKKLETLCKEINNLASNQNGRIAISIGYIVESIRRIGEYAEDISEIAINYLIAEK